MDMEPKENSDLLVVNRTKNQKTETNGTAINAEQSPPDGGLRAYLVLLGSFLTNGLLFGLINSYSVIYEVLQHQLKEANVPNAESRASLVGALTMGTTFFLSPVSGILTGILGIRATAVLGGFIATVSLFLSSFVVNNVDALCFTYGFLYGLGASLAYTPSLAILGHYFKRHLGIVNGIVTVGSSVFTVIMPVLMNHMINNYGLDWMFRLLSIFTIGISLCGLLFKPISFMIQEKPPRDANSIKALMKVVFDYQIWKNVKYRLWAISMPVALFGYFVPYVHIRKFVNDNFAKDNVGDIPLQCIAAASGVGRLVFGTLSDKPGINRIMLQQISFYVIGILTIVLPFVDSKGLLIAICLGMGLFDGAFISLIGPIAFEFCGSAYAAQAIGFMLGVAATPLSVGPPMAGLLYEHYKSYTLAFILAGISPILGATLMFAIHGIRKPKHPPGNETDMNGHVSTNTTDIEKRTSLLLSDGGDHQSSL